MKSRSSLVLLVLVLALLAGACQSKATPTAVPTIPPTPILSVTSTVELPLIQVKPVGVVISVGNQLNFYDTKGGLLFQMSLPITARLRAGSTHIAGGYTSGSTYLPVIFYATKPSESLFKIAPNGNVDPLAYTGPLASLIGAPGLPVYAFGRTGGPALFTGTLDEKPAALIPDLGTNTNLGSRPLEVDAEDYKPVGVWFTLLPSSKNPYRIEPRQGLYFTDLVQKTTVEILPVEVSPLAITPDRQWAAYSDTRTSTLTIVNLKSKGTVNIPWLRPGDNTEAGHASFSLANTYLAWVEADSKTKLDAPDFQATICIAKLDGTRVTELPASDTATAAMLSAVHWAWPVGWLDDQRLVVQAREVGSPKTALFILDISTGRKMFLGAGEFVEFLYP